jgi:hypothetical protein
MLRRALVVVLVCGMTVVSCRQEQVNGPCGGLMDGRCSSSMECVTVGGKNDKARSICVKRCETTTLDCPPPGCCPSGSSCRPIDLVSKRVSEPDQNGMGWFCVPDA